MNCLFCEVKLEVDVPSYEIHIRYVHSIKLCQEFALGLFLLSDAEIDEVTSRLQTRIETFRRSGTLPAGDTNIFASSFSEVQTQSSSRDGDIELIGISEDSDSETEDIDESTYEKIAEKWNMKVTIKEENLIKEENVEERAVELNLATSDNCEDETAPVPPVNINTINLVDKFQAANQCKLCYTVCPTEDSLSRHERVVHKDDQAELSLGCITLGDLVHKCDECPGVGFLSENIVKGHRKIKHGKIGVKAKKGEKELSKCKLCYRNYPNHKQLEKHKQLFHKKDMHYYNTELTVEDLSFACTKCSYKFVSRNSLKIHLKQHFSQFNYSEFGFLKTECYNKMKRKFKCNLCYHEIQSFSHMVRHVTGWHKKETDLIKNRSTKLKSEYPCPECGLKFITKHSNFVHRLLHHYYDTDGK